MKTLKVYKTRLLNKQCETQEQFEDIQNKLNIVEMEILLANKKGGKQYGG